MAFFVYILTNKPGGTLYVGYTDDLARRLTEHQSKSAPGFSARYNLLRLVHFEAFDSREAAKQRERRLKHWIRDWKVSLIEADNPDWDDLTDRVPHF